MPPPLDAVIEDDDTPPQVARPNESPNTSSGHSPEKVPAFDTNTLLSSKDPNTPSPEEGQCNPLQQYKNALGNP